jgi:hypothetical protein
MAKHAVSRFCCLVYLASMTIQFVHAGSSTPVCAAMPICERYWKTPIVFVGTTESVQLETADEGYAVRQRAQLTVQEVFRGTVSSTAEIVTSYTSSNGYRSLPLIPGARYLVFADLKYGEIIVDGCHPVRLLDEAAEDLEYLRSAKIVSPAAMIYGTVSRKQWDENDDPDAPLPGVEIQIQRPGKIVKTVTDQQGNYSLPDLSAGKYVIQPLLAEKLEPIDPEGIEVPEHGCVPLNFETHYNGRIRGKVTDFEGQPLVKASVEIKIAGITAENDALKDRQETDNNGYFEISSLAPGQYILGVNIDSAPDVESPYLPTYYPGVSTRDATTVVNVGKGELLEGYDLRLQKIANIHTFTAKIISADGKPIKNAYVKLQYPNGSWALTERSNAKGEIEMSAYGDVVVSLQADAQNAAKQDMESEPIEIFLAHAPKKIEIRLKRLNKTSEMDP